MGLCYWEARQLWDAKCAGVSFARTLMVGRQSLSLHPREVRYFQAQRQRRAPSTEDALRGYRFGDYADAFLTDYLGVRELTTLDASAYEGAGLVHDMNTPLPLERAGTYDAVIESGSLEHIFNVPVALVNLMNLVRPGGRLFLATPANNLCGHGFYQFSPELLYRVFADDNGFEIARMTMYEARSPSVELSHNDTAFAVIDPAAVRERVHLLSRGPVMLLMEALKTRQEEPFRTFPMQSDYAARWKASTEAAGPGTAPSSWSRRLFSRLPPGAQNWLQRRREQRGASFSNTRHYQPLS